MMVPAWHHQVLPTITGPQPEIMTLKPNFFAASAGEEQRQFRPDIWVPTEIGVIVNRDPFVNFAQLV